MEKLTVDLEREISNIAQLTSGLFKQLAPPPLHLNLKTFHQRIQTLDFPVNNPQTRAPPPPPDWLCSSRLIIIIITLLFVPASMNKSTLRKLYY